MGYETMFRGSGRIEPALPDAEIKTYGWDENGESEFVLTTVDNSNVVVVDGQITVIGSSCTEVGLRYDEPHKGYDFDAELAVLHERCVANSVELTCDFRGNGEEDDDIWRTRIDKNTVLYTHASPALLWPDGEQGQL